MLFKTRNNSVYFNAQAITTERHSLFPNHFAYNLMLPACLLDLIYVVIPSQQVTRRIRRTDVAGNKSVTLALLVTSLKS